MRLTFLRLFRFSGRRVCGRNAGPLQTEGSLIGGGPGDGLGHLLLVGGGGLLQRAGTQLKPLLGPGKRPAAGTLRSRGTRAVAAMKAIMITQNASAKAMVEASR